MSTTASVLGVFLAGGGGDRRVYLSGQSMLFKRGIFDPVFRPDFVGIPAQQWQPTNRGGLQHKDYGDDAVFDFLALSG
jgi:hypothetical protein